MGDSGYRKYLEAMSGCSTMENPDLGIIEANDRFYLRLQALPEEYAGDVDR
jgi:hypothetical protein